MAADAFAAAEFEACCELPWPPLLPGASAVSTGTAVSVAFADAEYDGDEWPWPGVTPGSVGSLAADAFAAAEFEACCELPWPPLLPGASAVSTGPAVSVALADAEYDGDEWPWLDATPGSVGSLAADAFAAAEFEACASYRGPRYCRVRLQFRRARPSPWHLLTPSVMGASGRGWMRRPALSARWLLMRSQLPNSRRAASYRGPRYCRVRLQFRRARPSPLHLLTQSLMGASGRDRMRRPVLSARWPLTPSRSRAPRYYRVRRKFRPAQPLPQRLQRPSMRVLRVAVPGCDARFCQRGPLMHLQRPSAKPAASCRGPRYYRVCR